MLADKEKQGWKPVADDEVIKPTGRLYPTYQEICTQIRREVIASMEKDPIKHPRRMLRPWAAQFIESHARVREEAVRENVTAVIDAIDQQVTSIRKFFPDLGSFDQELEGRSQELQRALLDE